MDITELINELKDTKEKVELCNELIKINNYKIDILKHTEDNSKIEMFIQEMINKYRTKNEVKDFYLSKEDKLYHSLYDNLNAVERMIYNYILRKIVIDDNNK